MMLSPMPLLTVIPSQKMISQTEKMGMNFHIRAKDQLKVIWGTMNLPQKMKVNKIIRKLMKLTMKKKVMGRRKRII